MESVSDIVSKLNKPDIYSLICGFLFELKDDPKYSTLSELAYLLDNESFLNFIKYFEGQVVTVPTRHELRECVQVLLLFQYSEIEGKPWRESLELAGFDTSSGKAAHIRLDKLKETIKKYNYGNRNYQ